MFCQSHVFPFLCRTLDVQPNRVTVGGIRSLEPILQRRGHVESHDFVGCIMEFAVNGRPLEPSQALAAQGILDQYGNLISYYCKQNCKNQECMITEHQKMKLLCSKLQKYQVFYAVLNFKHFLIAVRLWENIWMCACMHVYTLHSCEKYELSK